MRPTIRKIDEAGNEILSLKTWLKKNPNKIYFDSKFEWRCWNEIKNSNLEFIYQPDSIEILKPFQVIGFKKNLIKTVSVQGMVYTPDFLIKSKTENIYIECKGYFSKVDRYRFKLCQHTISQKKLGHILLIKNDKEFKNALTQIDKEFNKETK